MRDSQVIGIAAAFAILIVVTLLELKRWLPPRGAFKLALIFVAGASIVGALYATGIPPDWFDGGKEGFGLAAMLLLSGFVVEREAGRTFGRPLLLGMSATLLALNFLAHV